MLNILQLAHNPLCFNREDFIFQDQLVEKSSDPQDVEFAKEFAQPSRDVSTTAPPSYHKVPDSDGMQCYFI